MTHFWYLLLLMASLIIFPITSQAQFTLSGELRPRFEFRDGYRTLINVSTNPAYFISQRSRLNLHYKNPKLETLISLQDVRVWGDEPHLQDIPSTAFHEAWGKIKFSEQWGLKLGRQELVYGNHRLMGNVSWTQQARSHDAAVLQWHPKGWTIDVGGAYNQMAESITGNNYSLNNYKTFGFLWINKNFNDQLAISFIGISDGFQESDSTDEINYRYTGGPVIAFTPSNLIFKGEGYGQLGQTPAGNDLSAYFFSVNAGYKARKLKSVFGVDYVSGTDANSQNEVHTFSTLYATNHKFYGHMDYFLNIQNDTRNRGLQDLYLKNTFKLSGLATLNLDAHYFLLSNEIADPTNPSENLEANLGTEIDGSLSYQLNDLVKLKAGYSFLLPTGTLETLKGGDADQRQHWAWVMVQMKPTFIKNK